MRPRLLFLSANLPYPPHSGPTNRTLHVLRELRPSFDITLLAFARRHHHPGRRERAEAAEMLGREIAVISPPQPIAAEWSQLRKVWDHLRSLVRRRPYTEYEYASADFERQLRSTIDRAAPDLVHLDSIDLFRWLRCLPPIPVVCTHHSVESQLLRRRASYVDPMAAWYLRFQAGLIERLERELCPSFALNIMMSDGEAAILRALAPGAGTLVVPNGVDAQRLHPDRRIERDRSRIVFLGPPYVLANRDAVEFFLASMWPAVRAQLPGVSLRVLGSCPAQLQARFEAHHGVTCAGYVEDLNAELNQAGCAIVPLRIGGGTRLKIVDAWATATPVVSTTLGCEGLRAHHSTNILIGDTPDAFAGAVVEVLGDGDLAQRLGTEGRRTVEEFYDWRRLGEQLRAAYQGILHRTHPAGDAAARLPRLEGESVT